MEEDMSKPGDEVKSEGLGHTANVKTRLHTSANLENAYNHAG
jgi:hypothetical protein